MGWRRLGWRGAVAGAVVDEATLPTDVEAGVLMMWSFPFA
jgi:hypothetical protein